MTEYTSALQSITQEDIDNQRNHPFYLDGFRSYPCNILFYDFDTLNTYDQVIKNTQKLIDVEYNIYEQQVRDLSLGDITRQKLLNTFIYKINDLQLNAVRQLNEQMKNKKVYYWSSTNEKYELTTINSVISKSAGGIYYNIHPFNLPPLPEGYNFQGLKILLNVNSTSHPGATKDIQIYNTLCNVFNENVKKE